VRAPWSGRDATAAPLAGALPISVAQIASDVGRHVSNWARFVALWIFCAGTSRRLSRSSNSTRRPRERHRRQFTRRKSVPSTHARRLAPPPAMLADVVACPRSAPARSRVAPPAGPANPLSPSRRLADFDASGVALLGGLRACAGDAFASALRRLSPRSPPAKVSHRQSWGGRIDFFATAVAATRLKLSWRKRRGRTSSKPGPIRARQGYDGVDLANN